MRILQRVVDISEKITYYFDREMEVEVYDMLIRFNVRNFLSFDQRENGKTEEFSMISGKVRSKRDHIFDDGKIKLLKFSAIYGANAAGKSNLVKALDFMRCTVVKGLPDGHTELYCKVEPSNKEKESYFELEILLNNKYYAYGFEVVLSESRFVSEWLLELNADNSETVIFERDISAGTYELGKALRKKGLYEKLDVYASDVCDDTSVLFLSLMNQNKKNLYQEFEDAVVFRDVFWWINNNLDINFPNQPISDYSYLSKARDVQEVCRVISAFGTGITDFKMVEVPIEKVLGELPRDLQRSIISKIEKKQAKIRGEEKKKGVTLVMRSNSNFFVITLNQQDEIRCQTIEFSHENKEILFELSEESDGTIRVLDLLEILLAGEGKTYVIDELDRCLHPSLTYKFVDTFLRVAAEKNIQLIVTTHESRIMDFDLLRRDEIWFVNKNKCGKSNVYSLEEYNARFDQKIDKAYLEGRYGGVPIFSTVFPVKED